jgi:hypothetical protein
MVSYFRHEIKLAGGLPVAQTTDYDPARRQKRQDQIGEKIFVLFKKGVYSSVEQGKPVDGPGGGSPNRTRRKFF